MRTLTTTLYSGLAALSLLVPAATHAETTVATVPQGYVTLTVSAGTGSIAQYNFLYAPLHSASTASGALTGQVSAFAASSITNSSAAWTASQLASTTLPHFIKITSGNAAGHTFLITANTDTSLTLDTLGLDLTTLGLAASDTYQIFVGDTILSLFGTPNSPYPILGGTSSTSPGDQIILHNGTAWIAYYYNTTTGTWRQGNSPTNRGSTYIRPDAAFIYSRMGASSFSMTIVGEVPNTKIKTTINSNGLSAIASYFPTDQTLGSLNIQNLPNWKKAGESGITSATADKVLVYSGSGWIAYHYNATASQWRQGNSPTDRTTLNIAPGTGLLIQRSGTAGSSILTLNSPYNL